MGKTTLSSWVAETNAVPRSAQMQCGQKVSSATTAKAESFHTSARGVLLVDSVVLSNSLLGNSAGPLLTGRQTVCDYPREISTKLLPFLRLGQLLEPGLFSDDVTALELSTYL